MRTIEINSFLNMFPKEFLTLLFSFNLASILILEQLHYTLKEICQDKCKEQGVDSKPCFL